MKIFLLIFLMASIGFAAGLDYLKDGKTVPVKIDTVTPANSNPYPSSYYNSSGVRVDLATQADIVKLGGFPAGSYDEITNLTTTAQTFTAPANAAAVIIEASSSNTNNVRYKIGTAATTTTGMRLEPGRSEYIPAHANISVIAEAGTNQVITVQWLLTQ